MSKRGVEPVDSGALRFRSTELPAEPTGSAMGRRPRPDMQTVGHRYPNIVPRKCGDTAEDASGGDRGDHHRLGGRGRVPAAAHSPEAAGAHEALYFRLREVGQEGSTGGNSMVG